MFFMLLLAACATSPDLPTAQATPVPEAPQATAPPVIRHAWSCPAYINSSYYVMDSDGYDVVVTAVCDMSGTISIAP